MQRTISQEHVHLLHVLGVHDALALIRGGLEARRLVTAAMWSAWIDLPVRHRLQADPGREPQLHAAIWEAERKCRAFDGNPLAWVPFAFELVPAADFAEATGTPVLGVSYLAGSHVRIFGLQVAEA